MSGGASAGPLRKDALASHGRPMSRGRDGGMESLTNGGADTPWAWPIAVGPAPPWPRFYPRPARSVRFPAASSIPLTFLASTCGSIGFCRNSRPSSTSPRLTESRLV